MLKILSKVLAITLGEPASTSVRQSGQSRCFAPAVEYLSGLCAPAPLWLNGLVAPSAEAGVATDRIDKPNGPLPSTGDGINAGKVSMQDFHFVMKQSKASSSLMAKP